ncbi:MAG: flavodoxin family protein [Clostridia bacterium]|nr:flavodoxin family protein [Clostridia bacterium]
MLFKMRCLFFSKAGNAEHIAQQIARTHKTTSDQIPPAYPSESEKLLFIGVEANGAGVDKKVMDFCANLSPARAKNVAFFVITKGNGAEAIEKLKAAVKAHGTEVVGQTHVIKVGGLFKQNHVKQSDVDGAIAWANKIVEEVAAK